MSKIFAAVAAPALLLAACSSTGSSSSSSPAASSDSSSATPITLTASFYPIQWLVQQVGGDRVKVTSATPSNVEPHDYELSPKQVADMSKDAGVFYVRGFQAAMDKAADGLDASKNFDLADPAKLEVHHFENAGGSGNGEEEKEPANAKDPHFWLDPVRMEDVTKLVAEDLSKIDPAGADTYKANAAKVESELSDLDSSFKSGLNKCDRQAIVTNHAAFGYLAERYGLKQISISGLDPEVEPTPADLRRVADAVKSTGATTVFTEELVSPKVADTLAKEQNLKTEVLHTLEAAPEGYIGYLGAMKENLSRIQGALGCK